MVKNGNATALISVNPELESLGLDTESLTQLQTSYAIYVQAQHSLKMNNLKTCKNNWSSRNDAFTPGHQHLYTGCMGDRGAYLLAYCSILEWVSS